MGRFSSRMSLLDLNPLPFSLNPLHYAEEAAAAPFNFLRGQLNDLVVGLDNLFEKLILHTPHPHDGLWEYHLVGNELGLAGFLAICLCFVVTTLAVYMPKKRVDAFYSFLIAIAVLFLGPGWFVFCRWLIGLGDGLSRFVVSSGPHHVTANNNWLVTIPADAGNLIGAITGLSVDAALGSLLVLILAFYQLFIIAVKVTGLIALMSFWIGRRSKAMADIVFTLAIVSMVLGKPTALACLQFGKLAIKYGSFGSAFIATAWLCAAIIAAIYSQKKLFEIVHRAVSEVTGRMRSNIMGHVRSNSSVFGRVETYSRKSIPVRVNDGILEMTQMMKGSRNGDSPQRSATKTVLLFGAAKAAGPNVTSKVVFARDMARNIRGLAQAASERKGGGSE